MASTAEPWHQFDAQHPHTREDRWGGFSELFHNPLPQNHQPFANQHHSFHDGDTYEGGASYSVPQVKSEYVEQGYDLFNSQQQSGFTTAPGRAAFQESPASSSSSTSGSRGSTTDLLGYASSYSSSSGSSRSPTYEVVSGLGSVPEEGVIPSSQYGGQTIAPNALASGTPMRDSFQQPSFTELVMDRPASSSSTLFPSPRQGMPPQHLPRMQQLPHDHTQHNPHYQSAIPRQFESQHQPFAAGLQSMNNVFDRGFHLGDGAATESDKRNGSDYSSSAAAGPYLSHYAHTPNRLAAGEQTVIVMSSRVAQKSYGNEKRFLCPPPTAVLLGHSWYTADPSRPSSEHGSPSSSSSSPYHHPQIAQQPPQRALATQVLISISGESNTSDGTLEWSTPAGKPIDPTEDVYADDAPPFHAPSSLPTHSQQSPAQQPHPARVGRCVGKQLYISDVDERKKRVEALVKISVTAQHGDRMEEHVLGTFTSKPIKVISKPSKKRQSAKNLELCINHGSTVSLFHRLRSQTVSTKYLCVSGSGASFKGSDGAPLPGLDPRHRSHVPSFVAKTASWDMFIIYIVDVTKPSSGPDTIVPPPFQPDYPPPPPNAIHCSPDNVTTPIYYNQTVVLQCLTSGVVSPVLIIRKVEQGTVIVGGGLADATKGVPDHYCLPGEVCGDPVSQLHKIAFEVYEPALSAQPDLAGPGSSGAFLSCMGEKVNTYRPVDVRQWNGNPMMMATSGANSLVPSPDRSDSGSPLMQSKQGSPDSSPFFPPSHSVMMQGSQSSPGPYGSAQPSPAIDGSFDFMGSSSMEPSTSGRGVRRKRGSLSTTGPPSSLANAKSNARGRKRVDSVSSISSRNSTFGDAGNAVSGALWSIDVGETSIWTIVGTDRVRYNFYIPPTHIDGRSLHVLGGNTPQQSQPIAPAMMVHKCSASEAGSIVSLHGENFHKDDPPQVFFGTEQSPLVEVRSSELVICRVPPAASNLTENGQRRPIVLVRSDGVVFPTSFMYP